MNPSTTRLNKYLSEAGYCSRRAADKLIDEGRVTINGAVPEMGTKVIPGDEVKVDGKTILNDAKKRTYIAFNKLGFLLLSKIYLKNLCGCYLWK